ncbi:unnamed protein product [Rotaria magnacalcarata]|uniref:Transposase Tc1-like domain-containing protein n=1 Tax=Rotaria magnacalcarata TaxID=392030 RepID=A0A816NBK0_9BILA|nr:unnamed protein product [Rotaria magnacalcarata]
MGHSKVTADKKIEIKTLLEIGFCQRQVARDSNVSQTCGRKKPSTEDDDRQLLYIMKKDRTKSSQMLAAEWILSNDKKLCGSTVRRRLISMGYKSYTAKRKPLRTPAQIKKHLTFAKDHQYWSNEWNNVIWNDEAHLKFLIAKIALSSRDLNPIENLWYYIDKEFKKSRPTNAGQLQTMIEDLWIGCYSNEM